MASADDLSTRAHTGPDIPEPRMQARGRACLVQYSGGSLGRRYYLDPPSSTLGRSSSATIMLLHESVSREHARCTVMADHVSVEDLGSANGTYVNEERIREPATLKDGDLLRLGPLHFKFFSRNSIESLFHDELYRQATMDAGTQIFNKRYLLDTLEAEFQSSRVHGRPLSVIYYDLDFFKKVNDTRGHHCGDYVLRESARVARSCLRKDDTFGRYGGEEFLVVLPNTALNVAAELAERIRNALQAHPFTFEDKMLTQTVSMGVSQMRPEFETHEALLGDADRKLYQSKHGGRNRVTA